MFTANTTIRQAYTQIATAIGIAACVQREQNIDNRFYRNHDDAKNRLAFREGIRD